MPRHLLQVLCYCLAYAVTGKQDTVPAAPHHLTINVWTQPFFTGLLGVAVIYKVFLKKDRLLLTVPLKTELDHFVIHYENLLIEKK